MAAFNLNTALVLTTPAAPATTAGNTLLLRGTAPNFQQENHSYEWFTLTDFGNVCLFSLCHTDEQKRLWAYPHHQFLVRVVHGQPVVTGQQLRSARQGYVNALLIASRGIYYRAACPNSLGGNFGPVVRAAGFFGGGCASCEFKSHRNRCPCVFPDARMQPSGPLLILPAGTIQDLV